MVELLIFTLLWPIGFLLFRRLPFLHHSTHSEIEGISVSIIIPARNEERNITTLLESLKEQDLENVEVIVVDDDSDDRTSEVARDAGAKVVRAPKLPAGWFGKPWACWNGANMASGEVFVFLDADISLSKNGLKKILHTYRENGGCMTIQPYHVVKKPYEQLSALFNLVVVAAFSLTKEEGAYGPCLVCERDDYFRVGGHETIRSEVLENFSLARKFGSMGMNVRGLIGKDVLSVRMYPEGFTQLIGGWSKHFARGAGSTPLTSLLAVIAWVAGGFSLFMNASLLWRTEGIGIPLWFSLLYLAYVVQMGWMLRQVGSFRWYTALFYPIPFIFFFIVFIRSLFFTFMKKNVTWKGRDLPTNK
ncbi:glycosyltransferase [Pseudalkalibacillus sp. Hm43]|uniref:glycosyltransferase n=1 Tax=Pseudalkalibacillus sp. Hm43 TaxID=3450742 RepID=UPI003F422F21